MNTASMAMRRFLQILALVVTAFLAIFLGYPRVHRLLQPVVPGHPTHVSIAEFRAGTGGSNPYRAGTQQLHGSRLGTLIDDLNAAAPLGSGTSSCPQYHINWFDIARFTYPDRAPWTVEVLIGRCASFRVRSNVAVWAAQYPQLLVDLGRG